MQLRRACCTGPDSLHCRACVLRQPELPATTGGVPRLERGPWPPSAFSSPRDSYAGRASAVLLRHPACKPETRGTCWLTGSACRPSDRALQTGVPLTGRPSLKDLDLRRLRLPVGQGRTEG